MPGSVNAWEGGKPWGRGEGKPEADEARESMAQVELRHRYPGAGPFQDDDISRKTFFGRKKETLELSSRVEVRRLTIVFGRSGLGKSSLLQAGLTSPLRENGYFPVFVRVNHASGSLTTAIADFVEAEAERLDVEHVRGVTDSPWEYFKTVELWSEDRLLIPVIILDQFEEVFSVDDEVQQDAIIEELGLMVRGAPSGISEESLVQLEDQYGSAPPVLRIVVAIREDYLGHLEEVAGEIPGIFDSRFRVTPLSREAAAEALTLPATIESEEFKSAPFDIDGDLLTKTLDFLSLKRDGFGPRRKNSGIEPFQLQLVGRRLEDVSRQLASASVGSKGKVTLTDIGGDEGLTQALSNFYTNALAEVDGWFARRKVKTLCLDHLISPDGKRQSLDMDSISALVGLEFEVIQKLTESRLLGADTRADTQYYELSHDTLVAPILASQGASVKSFQFVKSYALILGAFSFLVCATVLALVAIEFYFKEDLDYLWVSFVSVLLGVTSWRFFKHSALSYKRRTRLKRLSQNHAYSINRPGFLQFFASLMIVIYGLFGICFGPLLIYVVNSELSADGWLYLDNFMFILGALCSMLYGVVLLTRGLRKILGNVPTKERSENTSLHTRSASKKLLQLILVILFGLISSTYLIIVLASLLSCDNEWLLAATDYTSKFRLIDMQVWCVNSSYTRLDLFFYTALFVGCVWFPVLQIYLLLRRGYFVQFFSKKASAT